MPKNLTVIAEFFADIDRKCTVDRSMNEILMSYKRHFEEVHYIGPGIDEITRVPGISDGIYLSTFSRNPSHLTIAPDSYLPRSKIVFLRKKQGLAVPCSLSSTTELTHP